MARGWGVCVWGDHSWFGNSPHFFLFCHFWIMHCQSVGSPISVPCPMGGNWGSILPQSNSEIGTVQTSWSIKSLQISFPQHGPYSQQPPSLSPSVFMNSPSPVMPWGPLPHLRICLPNMVIYQPMTNHRMHLPLGWKLPEHGSGRLEYGAQRILVKWSRTGVVAATSGMHAGDPLPVHLPPQMHTLVSVWQGSSIGMHSPSPIRSKQASEKSHRRWGKKYKTT